MADLLAPNVIAQGDPEANRRFAGALAAPAKMLVDALRRDATNQKALGRDVAYSLAQKAATPEEAVRAALGPGVTGQPGGIDMAAAGPLIAILRKYALLPAGVAGVGALGAVATPDQAQAAPVDARGIAKALREGR